MRSIQQLFVEMCSGSRNGSILRPTANAAARIAFPFPSIWQRIPLCRWVDDVNLIEILSKGAQGTENGKCAAVRELLCAQEALS